MELKIDKTLGKGVSIPFKKLKNVYSAFDELFDEILTFNKYKFFLVGITIVNEEECFWIPEKHMRDTFIVECKYPMSKISDLLLEERAVIVARLVLRALYEFYKHHKQDISEIDLVKRKLELARLI